MLLRDRSVIGQLAALTMAIVMLWPACALAADIAPASPRKAVPGNGAPFSAPAAGCLEWTDGCRVCVRAPDGATSCSNVGIACVQQDTKCVRR